MCIPLVVCYTIDNAMQMLVDSGITEVEIIKTSVTNIAHENVQTERVICQRERNGTVQLIVC